MTFICTWPVDGKLIIGSDTVSSDNGKIGFPPINCRVQKVFPLTEQLVVLSIGTDVFFREINSNNYFENTCEAQNKFKAFINCYKTSIIEETILSVSENIKNEFGKYKDYVTNNPNYRLNPKNIAANELVLLYYKDLAFHFTSIKTEVKENNIRQEKITDIVNKMLEFGLVGFREKSDFNISKCGLKIMKPNLDFNKRVQNVKMYFNGIYKFLRSTTKYAKYGNGGIDICTLDPNSKPNFNWVNKYSED